MTIVDEAPRKKSRQELAKIKDQIKSLWNGGKTVPQISEALMLSSDSVSSHIKKMRKDGVELRKGSVLTRAKVTHQGNSFLFPHRHRAPPTYQPPKVQVTPIFGTGIVITHLVADSCRYIVCAEGPHTEWRYCGLPREDAEHAYCAAHNSMCYIPRPQRKR